MKFKILFFFVCAPVFLFGQQFLDLKVSSELDFRNYPPSLNIEFGKNWWGIEAEAGYQFGQRTHVFIDPSFTSFDYKIENFRWKLIGNYYPFRNRGAGQGLKLGVGIFDDFEVWRDPFYYETLETITQMPVARVNSKPFKWLEYGVQIGYKRIFWKHLVAEASFMYAVTWVRDGNISYLSNNPILSFLIGYRFCFSSDE
jgi:hypothetical protein